MCQNKIDESTRDKEKPKIITFYNSTKSVVDVINRLVKSYNMLAISDVGLWYFFTAQYCGINVFITYIENNLEDEFSKYRNYFRIAWGTDLVQETNCQNFIQNILDVASWLTRLISISEWGTVGSIWKYFKSLKNRYFSKFGSIFKPAADIARINFKNEPLISTSNFFWVFYLYSSVSLRVIDFSSHTL